MFDIKVIEPESNRIEKMTIETMAEWIKNGYILYICTCRRITKVNRKTLARWEKSGIKLFANSTHENGFYIRSGRKWDYASLELCNIGLVPESCDPFKNEKH